MLLGRMLGIGIAYYLAAWFAINYTVTQSGIAVFWPANAILLSCLLTAPYRQWPALALAAFCAELLIDTPVYPLWASVAFGLINVTESGLAALLTRRASKLPFHFNRVDQVLRFLLSGPILAAMLAAILGALVYLQLARDDSSFLILWRLWWFGDALGLLLLTPILVSLWHLLERGWSSVQWPRLVELVLLLAVVAWLAAKVFSFPEPVYPGFRLTPFVLLPVLIWVAIRLGVLASALAVALIAAVAVVDLVQVSESIPVQDMQISVWLVQEYLAVMAMVGVGLAVLLAENREQKRLLQQRVSERTLSLQQANEALNQANQRLQRLVATDYLTGISNRRNFIYQAERLLQRVQTQAGNLCLVMLDLDHFKRVNDDYGHEAGDHVLQRCAAEVTGCIRPMDLFGRYGGEEFLVLLPDTTLTEARQIAERIRLAVKDMKVVYQDQVITVTISLGIAVWTADLSLDDLITQADQAMYAAKKAGRDCCRVYGPVMSASDAAAASDATAE
ncbi:MAG: diguanylate cyclase [Pseudomonadales bacterium]|nr:diguanylate cyclase [Pseudomonadales bacterium]